MSLKKSESVEKDSILNMKESIDGNRTDRGMKEAGNVSVLLLVLIIIVSLVPILSRNCPNVVYYGLVLLFFLSSAKLYLDLDSGKKLAFCLTAIYMCLIAMYKFFGISSADFSYYSTITKFMICPLAMMGVAGRMSAGQKRFVVTTILIVVAVVLADNMRLFLQYGPSAYVGLFQSERFTTNSVNTPFVASLVFFSGTLFVCFMYTKNMILKYAALAMSLFCVIFITAIAQRALILAMALLMFPLLILFNGRSLTTRTAFITAAVLLAFLILINIQNILILADNAVVSTRMSDRINQIRIFITTGDVNSAGGSLTARYHLTMQSIKTWTSSPYNFLFGAGDHRADYSIIGNHCFFFDEIARYGITGALIWMPMLASFMRQTRLCADIGGNSRLTRLISVMLFMFFVRSLIGSIMESSIGIQMFIFMPLVFSLLGTEDDAARQ